jgi:hypothetical protein
MCSPNIGRLQSEDEARIRSGVVANLGLAERQTHVMSKISMKLVPLVKHDNVDHHAGRYRIRIPRLPRLICV